MAWKLSFTNLAAATATVMSGSAPDSAFPAANLKTPDLPFSAPAKTTATGQQTWTVDFGSAQTIVLLVLARVNFTSATVEGNATDSWGAPSFSLALTITRNEQSGRYQWAGLLTAFTFRFMRIVIPAQTPTDGASGYLIGGIWAGATTDAPRDPAPGRFGYGRFRPSQDDEPSHKAWGQRLYLGEPRVVISATRLAVASLGSPFSGDEVDSWADVDRQVEIIDHFAVFLNLGDASQGHLVRNEAQPMWHLNAAGVAESQWELLEVAR